jgi:hypothetical protein
MVNLPATAMKHQHPKPPAKYQDLDWVYAELHERGFTLAEVEEIIDRIDAGAADVTTGALEGDLWIPGYESQKGPAHPYTSRLLELIRGEGATLKRVDTATATFRVSIPLDVHLGLVTNYLGQVGAVGMTWVPDRTAVAMPHGDDLMVRPGLRFFFRHRGGRHVHVACGAESLGPWAAGGIELSCDRYSTYSSGEAASRSVWMSSPCPRCVRVGALVPTQRPPRMIVPSVWAGEARYRFHIATDIDCPTEEAYYGKPFYRMFELSSFPMPRAGDTIVLYDHYYGVTSVQYHWHEDAAPLVSARWIRCRDDWQTEAYQMRKAEGCADCALPLATGTKTQEGFMLHDELWQRVAISANMLCYECVERRMGRELKRDDFMDCLLTDRFFSDHPEIAARSSGPGHS